MTRLHLDGELVDQRHPDYDQARRLWNGMVDRRPALIARCAGVRDVRAAVGYAIEAGLPLAVRGGGHSVAGHSVCDDGVVVDLSMIRTVGVDVERRRARVGGGALLGDLDRATTPHGLVVPAGHVSHTGVGGLTLGGGTGWLMRKWGLTIDSLVSAQVVTADGDVLTASEDEHADLFWAIRGGGGNFGIVTEFEFELHELGPVLLAGMLVYPLERAVDVLAFSQQWMAEAPDALTTFPVLMTVPPVEPFPPELQGRPALAYGLAYAGDVHEGAHVVDELRRAHPAALDLVSPMPYTVLQTMVDDATPHGLHHYNRSDYLEAVDAQVAEVLVSHFERVPSPRAQVITARMGGAVARVDTTATAFPHRDAPYLVWIANQFDPTPDAEPHLEWGRSLYEALQPFATGDVYVNALADESDDRVQAAYGGNWNRLRDVKSHYDPDNVFRGNANIPPRQDASARHDRRRSGHDDRAAGRGGKSSEPVDEPRTKVVAPT